MASGDPEADSSAARLLDATRAAFLQRRLHRRRLRAAALRALKLVSAGEGAGVAMDFDDALDIVRHVPAWMAAYAARVAAAAAPADVASVPRLSIVIMIVGSRGDVQPFVPIGQRLALHHRVRIATHREFRPLVERAGLEFYPLAGDPRELSEYMVKTAGRVVPMQLDQIIHDIPKQRAMIAEILASTWRACTEADPERPGSPAFRAEAIIANPPSYGHIHCAEALHLPLHIVFTMPWTPTSAFPHPFARLSPGDDRPVRNYLSYAIFDLLIWSGLGDLINDFREHTLGLPRLAMADGAALLEDDEIPCTYLWPSELVAKPPDWGPHIDLANFVFSDSPDYRPPPELDAFFAAGEAPIYIGFGSMVVEDSGALRRTIFAALEQAGVRAVMSEGWAHLAAGEAPPANVCMVGDVPHDWLFPRCRAVCHHGGAGTTAAGLRAGRPTVVVPFFGDQFFWGHVIAAAGAGPEPIPIGQLDAKALAAAFAACDAPAVRERARALGAIVRKSDGADLVVRSVYRHLPLRAMVCATSATHLAVVYCDTCRLRLCTACAAAAHARHTTHPYRYVEWGVHPQQSLVSEVVEWIGDAAHALHEGLEELQPHAGRRSDGVVFSDSAAPADDPPGPLRKMTRWLRGA